MAIVAQWLSVRLWYERLRVQVPSIAQKTRKELKKQQARKKEDVENEKTCSIERIVGNHKKSE